MKWKKTTSTRPKRHDTRNPSVSKSKAEAQTVLFLYMHYTIHANYSPLVFEHCKIMKKSDAIESYYGCLLIRHLCVFSTGLPFTILCEQWISVNCLLIPVTYLYLLVPTSKKVRRAWSQKHLDNAQKIIWLLIGCYIHHFCTGRYVCMYVYVHIISTYNLCMWIGFLLSVSWANTWLGKSHKEFQTCDFSRTAHRYKWNICLGTWLNLKSVRFILVPRQLGMMCRDRKIS